MSKTPDSAAVFDQNWPGNKLVEVYRGCDMHVLPTGEYVVRWGPYPEDVGGPYLDITQARRQTDYSIDQWHKLASDLAR